MPSTCAVCQKSENLKQCTACKQIAYCSVEHQRQDWPQHKELCKAVKEVKDEGFLKWKILEEGDNKTYPKKGDKVIVHYEGKLVNGVEFDSSFKRDEPFSFIIGRKEVIRGWDEGLKRYSVGEKAILVVDSESGYGAHGAGDDIPPNATLVFTVKLLEIVKA